MVNQRRDARQRRTNVPPIDANFDSKQRHKAYIAIGSDVYAPPLSAIRATATSEPDMIQLLVDIRPWSPWLMQRLIARVDGWWDHAEKLTKIILRTMKPKIILKVVFWNNGSCTADFLTEQTLLTLTRSCNTTFPSPTRNTLTAHQQCSSKVL